MPGAGACGSNVRRFKNSAGQDRNVERAEEIDIHTVKPHREARCSRSDGEAARLRFRLRRRGRTSSASIHTVGSPPGTTIAKVTLETPGSASRRRISSVCRPAYRRVNSRASPAAAASGFGTWSIPSCAERNSSAANPGSAIPARMVPHALKTAAGKSATAKPTCATISTVQVFPSRMPEPPAPMILRPVCTRRPVALSAGTTPTIAAASTLSAPAYRTAPGESSNDTQKGSSDAICTVAAAACRRARSAIATPASAAAADSTNASIKSCATMRPRLAPSALRTAISACRVAVRALHEDCDVQADNHEEQ